MSYILLPLRILHPIAACTILCVHTVLPRTCQAFLDAHGVVVYVTFGSRVPPPPSLVRTVGEGLVAGGWAVVWSLKRAEASHLPRGESFLKPPAVVFLGGHGGFHDDWVGTVGVRA